MDAPPRAHGGHSLTTVTRYLLLGTAKNYEQQFLVRAAYRCQFDGRASFHTAVMTLRHYLGLLAYTRTRCCDDATLPPRDSPWYASPLLLPSAILPGYGTRREVATRGTSRGTQQHGRLRTGAFAVVSLPTDTPTCYACTKYRVLYFHLPIPIPCLVAVLRMEAAAVSARCRVHSINIAHACGLRTRLLPAPTPHCTPPRRCSTHATLRWG